LAVAFQFGIVVRGGGLNSTLLGAMKNDKYILVVCIITCVSSFFYFGNSFHKSNNNKILFVRIRDSRGSFASNCILEVYSFEKNKYDTVSTNTIGGYVDISQKGYYLLAFHGLVEGENEEAGFIYYSDGIHDNELTVNLPKTERMYLHEIPKTICNPIILIKNPYPPLDKLLLTQNEYYIPIMAVDSIFIINRTRELENSILNETDSVVKNILFIKYVENSMWIDKKYLNLNIYQKALEEISPSSKIWAMGMNILPEVIHRIGYNTFTRDYLNRAFSESNYPTVKTEILADSIETIYKNDEFEIKRLQKIILNDYSFTYTAKRIANYLEWQKKHLTRTSTATSSSMQSN